LWSLVSWIVGTIEPPQNGCKMKKRKKTKRKRRKGAGKGSNFEREICKKLSLWWTDDKRDDVFWRTAGSGARATVRNKNTFGQHGDVQATDPIGQPLIDLCNIELKRGYNASTLSDFLDRVPKKKESKCQLQKFIEQAITDCRSRDDGSEWMLLVKRDYKEVILFTPYEIIASLLSHKWQGQRVWKYELFQTMRLNIKIFGKKQHIHICTLDWFLERVKVDDVTTALHKRRKGRS